MKVKLMKYCGLAIVAISLTSATWVLSQNIRARTAFPPPAATKLIQPPPNQRVEVGLVRWGRDFDKAQATSRSTGKPILVLFQEVPGCAGCQKFGREVLSKPLIVDAIESEFVPVLVFNNRSTGSDAALLKRFAEPAWNYQVIRFLDGDAKDIVPRKDQIWTVAAVAGRLAESLSAAKRPVPKYLQSLVADTSSEGHGTVAFAMSCFWTGEFELGKIDGVTETEAGWLDGREVTLVKFNEKEIRIDELVEKAAKVRCANKIYTPSGRRFPGIATGKLDKTYRSASASDQKKQLSRWPLLRSIPDINEVQLTKLNALIPQNKAAASEWLSPRQREWLAKAMR